MGDRGRATRDVIGDAAVMESGCTPDAVRARPTPVRQVDGEARCLCVPFGVRPSVSSRNRVVADDQTLDLAVLVLGDEEQVNQRTDVGGVFPTRRLGCV